VFVHSREILSACVLLPQDPDIVEEFSVLIDKEIGEDEADFDAVKPWVAASIQPSRPVKPHPSPPDEQPVIDWVHGYK
jgi:hypothetical protein